MAWLYFCTFPSPRFILLDPHLTLVFLKYVTSITISYKNIINLKITTAVYFISFDLESSLKYKIYKYL